MSSDNQTPETVQTVQTDDPPKTDAKPQRLPFFEVAQDADGNWHWMLWSGNGREMATNSIPYERKKDAMGAIAAFKESIGSAKTIVQGHE